MPVSKEPALQSLFLLLRESGGGRVVDGGLDHLGLPSTTLPPSPSICVSHFSARLSPPAKKKRKAATLSALFPVHHLHISSLLPQPRHTDGKSSCSSLKYVKCVQSRVTKTIHFLSEPSLLPVVLLEVIFRGYCQ